MPTSKKSITLPIANDLLSSFRANDAWFFFFYPIQFLLVEYNTFNSCYSCCRIEIAE